MIVVKDGIGENPVPSASPTLAPPVHVIVSPPIASVVTGMGPIKTPVPLEIFEIGIITGIGLTVIVKLCVVPVQMPLDGVIVIVASTGTPLGLSAVKDAISPTPLAGKPIDGVSFVQLYEAEFPLNVTAAVDVFAHKT